MAAAVAAFTEAFYKANSNSFHDIDQVKANKISNSFVNINPANVNKDSFFNPFLVPAGQNPVWDE